MFKTSENVFSLAARILIALLFIPAGWGKLTGFSGTVGYIASVGLPLPTVAAVVALLIELLGGFALLAGYRARAAALVLAVFTLFASLFFHAFWSVPADQAFVNQLLFFKNIAIIGGLFSIVAHGAGQWSLDARNE
jgi:putative oxidoreductase